MLTIALHEARKSNLLAAPIKRRIQMSDVCSFAFGRLLKQKFHSEFWSIRQPPQTGAKPGPPETRSLASPISYQMEFLQLWI